MLKDRLQELKAEAASLPELPGVYLMKDQEGKVIYVGKAKNLRARVLNYFQGGDGRHHVSFLMHRVCSFDRIYTETEKQAFLLERDLITKYKPRYNIRLKDDKAYLSIRIDIEAQWPRLELVRRRSNDSALYFGPYAFSYELRTLLEVIKRVVPLRTCSDVVFHNRQRPCLEYQIKRCAGPCCLEVDYRKYQGWVKQAISILEGKAEPLIESLESNMERASGELRFEDAAAYRDKIDILKNFSRQRYAVSSGGESRDVFGLHREDSYAALAVLQVRDGRISDNKNYALQELELSDQEIIEASIMQYYERASVIPNEVIVPFELSGSKVLEEFLSDRRGESVQIVAPQRGIRFRLLGMAQLNARQHFIGSFEAEQRYEQIAVKLASKFKLKQVPRRIECIDISQLQGSDTVGAIVSFFDGSPDRARYRQYKLSQEGKPDDFSSIYEVVHRRLKRGIKQEDLPDLLVIDGGKGQLSKALQARDELGLELEIVALAKSREERVVKSKKAGAKPERVFLVPSGVPIDLKEGEAETRFMSRVRDEVHDYVIRFHRKRRQNRLKRSIIDEVSGIGPERKRRLIKGFGSIEKMRVAELSELARVGRMPLSLAERLKVKLQEG